MENYFMLPAKVKTYSTHELFCMSWMEKQEVNMI